MSREQLPDPMTGSSGLMPLDVQTDEKAPSAGVFRLETMAPGMNSAEAMAAPKRAKFSTQAVALAVLLAVGGGLIYGMRVLGMGRLTSLGKTEIPNYDLTHQVNRAAENKRILQDLAANHAASQVPVDEVQKNPFRMADALTPAPANPGDGSRAAAERELASRRGKVKAALAGLKINGVINGAHPVARISGEAVRVGDRVADYFTVKAIHDRTVELDFDGNTYEISMDDADANSTKPHKK